MKYQKLKTDTIYENEDDYFKDLLIELNDEKHGEYLLIKEIGKAKLVDNKLILLFF